MEDWPDLIRIERKPWDDWFVAGTSYPAGKTVVDYVSNTRSVSLADGNTAALSDTTKWWQIDHTLAPAAWSATATYTAGDVVGDGTTMILNNASFGEFETGIIQQAIISSSAYEAMLKGTPRKMSAERW